MSFFGCFKYLRGGGFVLFSACKGPINNFLTNFFCSGAIFLSLAFEVSDCDRPFVLIAVPLPGVV